MNTVGWHRLSSDPIGSEGGRIVSDEEHDLGARISLEEQCGQIPFAITCGIYGWMLHTRYFSDGQKARDAYAQMKRELEDIVDQIPTNGDTNVEYGIALVTDQVEAFVARNQ
ncbi:MAG: hypothetical protein Rubg2KO_22010 [Rubricoccaceae bacterium]